MQHYIGIDVSKNDFYACFDDFKKPEKFNNNHLGVNQFIKCLPKTKKNVLIGIESTSRYHLPVCILCTKAGYGVKLINSYITKKERQVSLRSVKNDSADSRTVRLALIKGHGYIFKDSSEILVLKSLVRQRYFLVHMKADLKRKQGDIAYKELYIGSEITNVNHELEIILDKRIKAIGQQLETYQSEVQGLLKTIPGVGRVTAAVFTAEIGDVSRFSHPKQLVAFVGLDPRVFESGISIHGKGYITKKGNRVLRKTLFNAAMAAIQKPNLFSEFYERKVSEGKPKKVCLCAVMRKMVHVIYAVWKRKSAFV